MFSIYLVPILGLGSKSIGYLKYKAPNTCCKQEFQETIVMESLHGVAQIKWKTKNLAIQGIGRLEGWETGGCVKNC